MKNKKCVPEAWVGGICTVILVPLALAIIIIWALFARDIIHSAILPDEDQTQCESLGGKWSVNHQCYNAGEPTTIKKLKENLRSVKE